MEEHTEKILKDFFCYPPWFSYTRLFGHISSLVLLSGYYPLTNSLSRGKSQGPKLRAVLPGQKQHFENWHVFHIENPQACAGRVEKATTLAFSQRSSSVLQRPSGHICVSPGRGEEYDGWPGYWNSLSLRKGTAARLGARPRGAAAGS